MLKADSILTSHSKFHINLGLERIEKILSLLGNVENSFQSILIAGTNGKGSTAAIINQGLIDNFENENIGFYSSPHLFSYEERIKVNNENISSYIFDKLVNNIDEFAKKNSIELSEFELLTAVAFYYFYIKKVRFAVLEVGLGGLFDAVNVIKNSPIQIITTVDFDHKERLGDTIDEIAYQKAGIIKKYSKVIINDKNKGFSIVQKEAQKKEARLIIPDKKIEVKIIDKKNYAIIDGIKYQFGLLGAHQADNLSLALSALNELGIKIKDDTLKKVFWPYRLTYNKEKNILIDGAHNPSGIETLRTFLDDNFQNIKKEIFFGCLRNKDYKTMLDILINKKDKFFFIEFNHKNSLLYNELDEKYKKNMELIKKEDISFESTNKLKVFCGSLYMLGEIFKDNRIL